MIKDTIYALSTPLFKSAIAVVRVSGDDCLKSLEKITKKDTKSLKTRYFYNSKLYDAKNNVIDDAMFVYFDSKSYTGEQTVEYYLHGSISVIKELIKTLSSFKSHRLAERGEFTKRAYLNGKLDLLKAQSVNDLINAETFEQSQNALSGLSGDTSNTYKTWKDEILNALTLIEGVIDFSDDGIYDDFIKQADLSLKNLINELESYLKKVKPNSKIKDGIKVVLFGNTNVGKSSILNSITNSNSAIVSNVSGTTRDVIEKYIDLNGYAILLKDTAGIRESKDEVENIGILKTKEEIENADILICVADATRYEQTYSFVKQYKDLEKSILVVNKSDLEDKNDYGNAFVMSAHNENNIEKLKEKIVDKIKSTIVQETPHKYLLEQNYIDKLSFCKNDLLNAVDTEDIVIKSFHVRKASVYIEELIGSIHTEDILDNIFSNFCIGK